MGLDFITALRRNHAIEHATAAVLVGKIRAGTRLMGRATTDGFYIYGDASTEAVSQAAEEGLARLKQGEHNLAVSPLCGTNLAVAALLAGLASMLAMRGKKETNRLPNVLLATLAAVILAQPLGRLLSFPLAAEIAAVNVNIAGVTSKGKGMRTHHKIRIVLDKFFGKNPKHEILNNVKTQRAKLRLYALGYPFLNFALQLSLSHFDI